MKNTALAMALFSVIAFAPLSPVQAEEPPIKAKNIYVGGGLGFHQVGGFSARGFQFLAGYKFDFLINEDIRTAIELGYMDSGNFDSYKGGSGDDAKGLWFSAVESVPLTSKTGMLMRLGYDFGDDDGFLVGAGMEYRFDTRVSLRSEYVVREHISGLQFNLLVNF